MHSSNKLTVITKLAVLTFSAIILAGCTSKNVNSSPMPKSAYTYHDNIYKVSAANYLTDFEGRPLYVSDQDLSDKSNCLNACEKNWPYYTSGATSQKTFPPDITIITRPDGSLQFAWKGHPLYYYAKDSNNSAPKGDNIDGSWHLAK